ncbi:tRNA(Ser) Um(44) 2'-O-methyltransferase [Zalaria obscura]|uniref:tRNA(Ser) Um(44) 2'-O-methyltransferase n=1 Tax=Zalaria obscura TaxID=2024903 RepID=A0ACC3SIK5_9PEZI
MVQTQEDGARATDQKDGKVFNPVEHMDGSPPLFSLPAGKWTSMMSTPCTFPPSIFERVMLNLIKNPNIMSSHLFRADIFYDSDADKSLALSDHDPAPTTGGMNGLSEDGRHFSDATKHLKQQYRPVVLETPGWKWQRTFVRQLVPRNPQLDKHLAQSCHFYSRTENGSLESLVLYVPHVATAEEMPWYHPNVQYLAFLHQWPLSNPNTNEVKTNTDMGSSFQPAMISVHFSLFLSHPLDNRLQRTSLQLLRTLHKHGQGQQAGYVKRVHHDLIVPQQRFQETYSRLKTKYAKQLIDRWVEVTDPGKHVFEDLGIAAFLIELWTDMYTPITSASANGVHGAGVDEAEEKEKGKPTFPGFVDIGCGNGLLIYLLISEGYHGYGFDVRRRKTWSIFPSHVQECIHEQVLVPDILLQAGGSSSSTADAKDTNANALGDRSFHPGTFPKGTFIISNHADELTPWTPLLAYLNESPFIAIPCCSHSLSGGRFRAPAGLEPSTPTPAATRQAPSSGAPNSVTSGTMSETVAADRPAARAAPAVEATKNQLASAEDPVSSRSKQAAETGSLARPASAKHMPSAYASLCDYVASLSRAVGFEPEKEMLRIPSTRNACILGRKGGTCVAGTAEEMRRLGVGREAGTESAEEKNERVRGVLEGELEASLPRIRDEWIARARQIAGKKGDGH